ncbi:hypothetical protein C8J57DRAFT_1280428 [Mycena rebaudengoi]|nr:hypothetical protein C8J57DRAFT_1280428 [Mycena rebaudengoi]
MFTASTTIRTASSHCRLSLNAVHHLEADSKHTLPVKTRFPDDVDVVVASDLVLSLSGVVDRVKVSSGDILKSELAQHLADYFQAVKIHTTSVSPRNNIHQNAAELGIAPVSSMYIDSEDGLPKLKLVFSRCLVPESEIRRVHVTLVAMDLNYIWHTSKSDSESASNSLINPFSTHLSLPFRMLLDNAICRFVTWHLVRRYPLIFGRWCQQLDIEKPYFEKIFRSISNIMERSSRSAFRKKCARMLANMQEQHAMAFSSATSSLTTYFGSSADSADDEDRQPALTEEEAFGLSMEIRYRTSMRRLQFKGSTRTPRADGSDDEELSQDHSLLTPDSSPRFDEDFLWPDASLSTVLPDFGYSFDPHLDRIPSPRSNMEHRYDTNTGLDIDPLGMWSDIEVDDSLTLSSDDEPSLAVHFASPIGFHQDALFAPITPPAVLKLLRHGQADDKTGSHRIGGTHNLFSGPDVNKDLEAVLNTSHTNWSPDLPVSRSNTERIHSSSPPATSRAPLSSPPGTAGVSFSGLSSKHCQEDTEARPEPPIIVSDDFDLEMFFDSDCDKHDLEEFDDGDALRSGGTSTCHHIPDFSDLELEDQVSNGICAGSDLVEMQGWVDEEFFFDLEDW